MIDLIALDLDGTKKCIDGVRAACAKAGRKFEDVEISVTPRGAVDLDTAKRYADLGVHRLILLPARDEAGILKQVSQIEHELIGKV